MHKYSPDYLEHFNKNHDRLGRFASGPGGSVSSAGGGSKKSSISEKRSERKKKKAAAEKRKAKKARKQQQRVEQQNAEKKEQQKRKAIESGSATDVKKHLGEISNKDLEYAVKRLNMETRIKDMAKKENPKKIDTLIDGYIKYGGKVSSIMETTNRLNKAFDAMSSTGSNNSSSQKKATTKKRKKSGKSNNYDFEDYMLSTRSYKSKK